MYSCVFEYGQKTPVSPLSFPENEKNPSCEYGSEVKVELGPGPTHFSLLCAGPFLHVSAPSDSNFLICQGFSEEQHKSEGSPPWRRTSRTLSGFFLLLPCVGQSLGLWRAVVAPSAGHKHAEEGRSVFV